MKELRRYTLKTDVKVGPYLVDYEKELNPEQLQVVMAGPGPLLVIAGAGSGKTRTVTYRVARLIESGVDPGSILLLTFTNKAAREMLHRVELLIKGDVNKVWGGTFHHVANIILRRHADLLGYGHNYSILDREDCKTILNSCIAELKLNIKERRFPKGDVLEDMVSLAVNTGRTLEQVARERYPFFISLLSEIEEVAKRYQTKKKEINVMSFDDLLINWKRLLTEFPQIKELYSQRFAHVLVDEYQDTNLIQAEIVDLVASVHRNIMVVGDDAQSIYSFRGANFANIFEFPKRYPDATTYKLTINYRSTPEILHLANESISFNERQFPKELRPISKPGSNPVLVAARDLYEQADFVAQRILEIRDEGRDLNHMAVLYRSHYHCMELQMELTRRGIPFEVRSGLKFFEQAHLKDLLAHLKILYNPLDELSWKRLLKLIRNIGNATAEKVWQFLIRGDPLNSIQAPDLPQLVPARAREDLQRLVGILTRLKEEPKNPGQMIELVLTQGYEEYLQATYINYLSRVEDIRQLANFAARYNSFQRFLAELALLTDMTAEHLVIAEPEDERVTLSSVHQAKGLEWPVVFIIWLAEGKFPSFRGLQEQTSEEEERRLFYVAATRAKEELYLCYPLFVEEGNRRAILQKLSRFIEQVSEDRYERWVIDKDSS